MATDDTTAPEHSRALAVQPKRPVRVVEDIAPLFDTARFEHYGRIAAVMATATLIPDALKGATREETIGNCFMVVSMADRLGGFDPWSVAQCCSVVNGRLMLEGKLIAAAIRHKLGLELYTYYTGEKGKPDFRVYLCDEEFTDEMISKLEPGKGLRGHRVIDGSVAEWQTFERGGGVKFNWINQPDLQLYYRGTRVWARRFESGIMLGIYTEDEMEGLEDRRAAVSPAKAPRGTAAKLTSGNGGADQVSAAAVATAAREAGHEPAQDAEFAEVGEETAQTAQDGGEAATATDAPADGERQPTQAELDFATEAAKAAPGDEAASDILLRVMAGMDMKQAITRGHAELGEEYLLAGLKPSDAGRFLVFKDGVRSSTKGKVEGLKVYAIHAPEVVQGEDDIAACGICGAEAGSLCADDCPRDDGGNCGVCGAHEGHTADCGYAAKVNALEEGEDRPTTAAADTATDGVQTAGAEPATSEAAPPALNGGAPPEAASGPSAPAAGAGSDEGDGFLSKLRPLTTWTDIKVAWAEMVKSTDWAGVGEPDRDDVRRAVWAEVERVRADHGDRVDQATDVSAFSIWMATLSANRDGADALEGTFRVLKEDATSTWHKLGAGGQASVESRVAEFLRKVRG